MLPQTDFNRQLLFVYTCNFKVLKLDHIPFTKADIRRVRFHLSSNNTLNILNEPRTLINIVSDCIQ